MLLAHFYHNHHKESPHISDFWLYELSVWLHVVARSLTSVFIPILLYITGFPVVDILLFYILFNAFDVPLNFVSRALVRRLGARIVIVLGTLAAILFFSTFGMLQAGNWAVLALLAFLYALYDSLYWVAFLYMFMMSTQDDLDAGKKTGSFYIIRKLGTIVAPVIGGAVLVFWSRDILFYVSAVIFLLSVIPLYWVDEFQDKPDKPMLSFKEYFKSATERKNFLTIGLYSIHSSAESIMWPLFIFLVFGSIESVAMIPVIIGVSSILLTYYASSIKSAWREVSIIVSALMIVLVWGLRMFVDMQIVYYGSILLVALFALFITVPLDSEIFTRGKKVDALQTAVYRNATSMFFRMILFIILFILINVFEVSFMVASGALMILLFINTIYVLHTKCLQA